MLFWTLYGILIVHFHGGHSGSLLCSTS
jgi:hypothetical protein